MSDAPSALAWVDRAPRAARWTFIGLLVVAVPTWAFRGRHQWFNGDEWWFLSVRDAGSVTGWFEPHQEHWVTLPALTYRLLWHGFGLHHYAPFLAVAIASHVAVVVLLFAVLRRTGVSPWIAVASATVLLFFGPGSENVVWGFMITFTWSLASGLGLLLVADRDHLSPGRAVGAAACGVAAVACSGLGVIVVGAAGLALLVRRSWRVALVATGPALVVYLAWRVAYGTDPATPARTAGTILRFATKGLGRGLTTASAGRVGAAAIVVVVVVGLGLVVRTGWTDRARLRQELAIPGALALGAVGFFLLAGRTRAGRFGVDYATRGRFTYVAVVLLVPLVAVAADALARRWDLATVPVVVVLLAGVPGNVDAMAPRTGERYPPALVLAVASSPALDQVPRDTLPFPETTDLVVLSAGWFRDQIAAGRISPSASVDPDRQAEALRRLAVQVEDPGDRSLPQDCPPLEGPTRARLTPDHPLVSTGVTTLTVLVGPDGRSDPMTVGSLVPRQVSTRGPTIDVEVAPDPTSVYPQSLCR